MSGKTSVTGDNKARIISRRDAMPQRNESGIILLCDFAALREIRKLGMSECPLLFDFVPRAGRHSACSPREGKDEFRHGLLDILTFPSVTLLAEDLNVPSRV